jgi:hypothetical protein
MTPFSEPKPRGLWEKSLLLCMPAFHVCTRLVPDCERVTTIITIVIVIVIVLVIITNIVVNTTIAITIITTLLICFYMYASFWRHTSGSSSQQVRGGPHLDKVDVASGAGGSDGGSPGLGDLNGQGAHAPGPRLDQHPAALLHLGRLQRLPAHTREACLISTSTY